MEVGEDFLRGGTWAKLGEMSRRVSLVKEWEGAVKRPTGVRHDRKDLESSGISLYSVKPEYWLCVGSVRAQASVGQLLIADTSTQLESWTPT